MPLTFANENEANIIKKINGNDEVKGFLNNLGFVVGGEVTVVAQVNGSIIVNVKESRVALGREMANKVMV